MLVITGSFAPRARAQVASDTYDPSWPTEIQCPPAVQGHQLTRIRAIVADDAARTSTDVGDRSIDCRYGDQGPRIVLDWATHDNSDQDQWCGLPPEETNNFRLYLHSQSHRVGVYAEFVDSVRADIERMIHAAESMALPCGATATTIPTETCSPEGTVTSQDGAPVSGVRVELRGPGDDELDATGTDARGHYRFAPPSASDTFAPATDDVTVKVVLQDDAGVWDLWNGNAPAFIQTKPFKVAAKTCRSNIVLGGVGDASQANPSKTADWPPIVRTVRRLQLVARFTADPRNGLGLTLHTKPVTVYARCSGPGIPVPCPAAAQLGASPPVGEGAPFYSASPAPHIVLGPAETTGEGAPGCDSDTIPHEWGHALTTELFGGKFPHAAGSKNHAGYYGNAQSTDSWTEGFATYIGLEARKHAGGRPTPSFVWCQPRFAALDFETDQVAWDSNGSSEEWAVAGALLDLEDGPGDYQPAQVPNVIDRAARVIVVPGKGGRVVVGKIRQSATRNVKIRVDLLGVGAKVLGSGEAAIDNDGWFYFPVVPANAIVRSVRVYATRNGGRQGDDDPIHATPRQVWDAIARYDTLDTHRGRPIETTGVFDVTDLYNAMHDAFHGDRDHNGVDDVDQIFRAHGLFADVKGAKAYQAGAPIGPTTHPPLGAAPGAPAVERNDVILPPATWVKVDTGNVHPEIEVSLTYPAPHQDRGYSYLAKPAADGRVQVVTPPEDSGGVVTLTAIAAGRLPEVVKTIEPKAFWHEAAKHDNQPFLDLSTTLRTGDLGGRSTNAPPLAADLGALAAAGGLAIIGRRKRVLVISAVALGVVGLGLGAWSLTSGGSGRPGTTLTLTANHSLPTESAGPSSTAAGKTSEVTTQPTTPQPVTTNKATVPAPEAELTPSGFSATAVLPDDSPSNGSVISYKASGVGDHNGGTAWCAHGDASGEFITLSFGSPVTVTSVGIEPGYDKIDTASGRDRWNENRHVTAATYVFDDNTRIPVTFDGTRRIQQHHLDRPITTRSVEVVIDATTGVSDTCISEVSVLGRK